MTNEEAIDYFKRSYASGNTDDERQHNEALDAAIKALERDTPKRVKIEKWIATECPGGCGYILSTHHGDGYYSIDDKPEFCPLCGQRLDWREEEEDKREITIEESITKIFKKYDAPTSNPFFFEILKALEQEPMQVDLEGDGYADGELVYDYGKCPKCGWEFEDGDKDWEEPYCCHCGQKLHWFENEE